MHHSTLHQLLAQTSALPPEYQAGLSNHLPMALHALQDLGASDEQLRAFSARYGQRFAAAATVTVFDTAAQAPAADWRALRGQAHAWTALLQHFTLAVQQQGSAATVRAALPDLLGGLSAAGLHGPIRLAHAVEADHAGEVAAALAYWAWRWLPLDPPDAGPALDFDAWRAGFVAQAQGWTCEGALFSIRMPRAALSQPYRAWAGRLAPDPALLPQLAGWALQAYAETGNLMVLHMVTATRALRVLQGWLAETDLWMPHLVQALTAAWLSARLPVGLVPAVVQPAAWPDILSAARVSSNDHAIKLVHAALQWAVWEPELDTAARAAATRVLA